MDEIWERAVETALDGQNDVASVRTLTLDGAVKCVQGRLPPPPLFEKFVNLNHLSIANIGVSSLEQFPRLRNLQKLILSDNRIAGGLEFLVEAGLESLRDLDLSNNRIQDIDDLRPLAELKLASLDLYECPVTRVKDYRSRVFGLVKSLRYLDKMDADGNERPESDDDEEESGDEEGEEDEGEDEEENEDEDDPGSGEIDGEDRSNRMSNGHSVENDGVVDVDEDEESDADEEETETVRSGNGLNGHSNGFRVEPVGGEEDENEEDGEEEEEIDEEEDDDDDEDVIEVHEILDSDEEDDGVEDEDEDEEEVDNDEGDFAEPESTGRITSTEGEIDAHEQGEDDGDDEDDNGETEEEEMGVEEGNYEEEEAEDEVVISFLYLIYMCVYIATNDWIYVFSFLYLCVYISSLDANLMHVTYIAGTSRVFLSVEFLHMFLVVLLI